MQKGIKGKKARLAIQKKSNRPKSVKIVLRFCDVSCALNFNFTEIILPVDPKKFHWNDYFTFVCT